MFSTPYHTLASNQNNVPNYTIPRDAQPSCAVWPHLANVRNSDTGNQVVQALSLTSLPLTSPRQEPSLLDRVQQSAIFLSYDQNPQISQQYQNMLLQFIKSQHKCFVENSPGFSFEQKIDFLHQLLGKYGFIPDTSQLLAHMITNINKILGCYTNSNTGSYFKVFKKESFTRGHLKRSQVRAQSGKVYELAHRLTKKEADTLVALNILFPHQIKWDNWGAKVIIGKGMYKVRLAINEAGEFVAVKKYPNAAKALEEYQAYEEIGGGQGFLKMYDIAIVEGKMGNTQAYLFMELIYGRDIFATMLELHAHYQENPEAAKSFALLAMRQCCKVLNSLHEKGLYYADLKPENVILDFKNFRQSGELRESDFKLIDYGSVSRNKKLEGPRELKGSAGYFPPEVVDILRRKDCRTYQRDTHDIFSLGRFFLDIYCALFHDCEADYIKDLFLEYDTLDFNGQQVSVSQSVVRYTNELKDINVKVAPTHMGFFNAAGVIPSSIEGIIIKCMSRNSKERPSITQVLQWLNNLKPENFGFSKN